ncbi:PI3K-CA gamma [Monosiga brevicollis MX1]|uniref:PI3K-CA gamma n=1 Tax=Monosiga brevicollis TaxID=81824 RepID=A9UW26_MONBE|nr:PI3K-CA gamma [Monosiga brevicollis MX1]EDQ90489.1 PI3K-CA gamma [Monosiga brevicollis MX1]|eukprot:XP_001744540.1 PI3K-CA gamma [Monosiga brevicollis MX1]
MQRLWHEEGLDLHLIPYGCVATSTLSGLIEIVPYARTVASIQKAAGGSFSAFAEEPILDWLRSECLNSEEMLQAARNKFTVSCAGYCVATYVLGIGDRHNDNICVTPSGDFFHIDFGHFLGNIKTKFGVKRERAPFVLTPDFVFVIGGQESREFDGFIKICVQAYLVLRRHAQLLISLFAMMLSTGIPELQHETDIAYLRRSLNLDAPSEAQAAADFKELIYSCLKLSWTTQVNFLMHNLAH